MELELPRGPDGQQKAGLGLFPEVRVPAFPALGRSFSWDLQQSKGVGVGNRIIELFQLKGLLGPVSQAELP